MRAASIIVVGLLAACAPTDNRSSEERAAFKHCAAALNQLTRGGVLADRVPVVPAYRGGDDFSFAWNGANKLPFGGGQATASCDINRSSGRGFATLMGKDLGGFSVNAF